jgi:hypothetical protein
MLEEEVKVEVGAGALWVRVLEKLWLGKQMEGWSAFWLEKLWEQWLARKMVKWLETEW